jgi:hypothetical protein
MRTRGRCIRLVTACSMTAMLVAPAIAADETGSTGVAPTANQFCIYLDGRTDTPETGPMPCNSSRRYMIGSTGLGGSPIPTDDSSGPNDATMASPATPGSNSNSNRGADVEAP